MDGDPAIFGADKICIGCKQPFVRSDKKKKCSSCRDMALIPAGASKRNSDQRCPINLAEGKRTKKAGQEPLSPAAITRAVSAVSDPPARHLTQASSLDFDFEEAQSWDKDQVLGKLFDLHRALVEQEAALWQRLTPPSPRN